MANNMISIKIFVIIQKIKMHRCKSKIQELNAEKNKTQKKKKNQREKINGEKNNMFMDSNLVKLLILLPNLQEKFNAILFKISPKIFHRYREVYFKLPWKYKGVNIKQFWKTKGKIRGIIPLDKASNQYCIKLAIYT